MNGRSGKGRPRPALSERECQVRDLIAEGLGNKQIAARLNISVFTVKMHVRHLLDKFGVQSRQEIVCLLCDRNRP